LRTPVTEAKGQFVKLLLIRHAIAEEREEFAQTGEPDEKRPLTDRGRKKMKRVASGLADVVDKVDLIASSPLTRALETAEILAKRFPDSVTTTVGALEPVQSYETFLEWLQRLEGVETVAAVGHEPHLSGLAAWLLTGNGKSLFEMKKGGACLLEFEGVPQAGSAQLSWLMTPGQLRAIED
jgi:phosphohistidine phosphatase